MNKNYDRIYKIIIGNPEYKKSTKIEPIVVPPLISKSGKEETIDRFLTTTIPQDAVEITQLQFTANILKGGKGKGSKSEQSRINIYNCHPETVDKAQKEHAIIHIYAGYKSDSEDLPLIYAGQITKAAEEKSGSDRILKIQANAAVNSLKTQVSVTYPEGSKVVDVVEDMVSRVPNTVIGVTALEYLSDTKINNGLSVYGKIGDNIDNILDDYNGEWVIENGAVVIKPKEIKKGSKDFQTLYAKSYQITEDLIKSVTWINDNNGKTVGTTNKRRGVKLSTFLLPIKASYPITITEGEYKGDYKVTSVRYNLDYRGNNWDVEVDTESF